MKPRWHIVVTYLILLAVTIPWYWDWFGDAATQMILGLQRKNLVSILGAVGIAALTVWQVYQRRKNGGDK